MIRDGRLPSILTAPKSCCRHSLLLYLQPLGTVSAACAGDDSVEGGYNSEDEYSHIGVQLTEEEWQEKDRRFERLIKKKKG